MKIEIIVFVLCLSFFNLKANAHSDDIEGNTMPKILNVDYDYELFNKNDEIDCKGQLKFRVSIPPGAISLIYEKQGRLFFESQNHPDLIDFNMKWGYDNFTENSVEINDPEIYWGRYFRVRVKMEDDTWICSEIHNTKNYMCEEDLAILLQSAYVDDINPDDISVYINNDMLNINTSEEMDLVILDLRGQILFSGVVSQSTTIPLNMSSTPIIIVRYNFKNKTLTQKFKIL
ncbi:MAG: hypothetical protein HDS52_02015 [Barnesiella sp.]|nr:hypothetical protein [Barnesiella sp.]